MEALADRLKVPAADRIGFSEVYEALGEAGAKSWDKHLRKVRSNAEVEARIMVLAPEHANHPGRCHDRLLFCGRYSAKVGTPLDEALKTALSGFVEAAALQKTLGRPLHLKIRKATFGDEHAAARAAAFPYTPSVSASHGASVFEARAAEAVPDGLVSVDQLCGYVAMQGGGYVDDIAVFPAFQGQGVATALLAAAARFERSMSLDVRAANTPALKLYQRLGFRFGPLAHPGFLDWDGGYEGEAEATEVAGHLPPHADVSAL